MKETSWSGVTRWTGAVSNAWDDPGNWDNNSPTAQLNALIQPEPVNQPVISTTSACNNLIVEDNAILTITNSSTLTVHGSVILKGTQQSAGSISNMKNLQRIDN
jgi:hypothetical protein